MTIRDLCTAAAIEVNVLAASETLSGGDAAVFLDLLRRLLNSWNADRRAVYATSFLTFTLVPAADPTTIGPTAADFTVSQRPVSIDGANLVLTTSTPNVQLPIAIRDSQWWLGQSVPDLATSIPTDLYYQPDWPNGKLYFWPVPTVAYDVNLMARVVLDDTVTLDTTFTMPPGYRDALTLSLAEKAVRSFGVPADLAASVASDASKARALVFGNNDQIPRLTTRDAGMTPGRGGRRADFNYLNGAVV